MKLRFPESVPYLGIKSGQISNTANYVWIYSYIGILFLYIYIIWKHCWRILMQCITCHISLHSFYLHDIHIKWWVRFYTTMCSLRIHHSHKSKTLDPSAFILPPGWSKSPNSGGKSHTGWWWTHPSEKYESQLVWLFPIYVKIKVMFQSQPTSKHRLSIDYP